MHEPISIQHRLTQHQIPQDTTEGLLKPKAYSRTMGRRGPTQRGRIRNTTDVGIVTQDQTLHVSGVLQFQSFCLLALLAVLQCSAGREGQMAHPFQRHCTRVAAEAVLVFNLRLLKPCTKQMCCTDARSGYHDQLLCEDNKQRCTTASIKMDAHVRTLIQRRTLQRQSQHTSVKSCIKICCLQLHS